MRIIRNNMPAAIYLIRPEKIKKERPHSPTIPANPLNLIKISRIRHKLWRNISY
tara:strand:+ start:585 stop:746 length:162 start_codon:yes stop_codon:yes gene_type:complete